MSLPNSADFALISIVTAVTPTKVTKLLCGVEGVTINRAVQTNETYRRDCAAPNRPGSRKMRATGQSWSIGGSGSDNIDLDEDYDDALGVRKSYEVELFKDDGTDGGESLGVYAGTALMTARNQTYSQDASGTLEITLEGEDALVWTPST